MDDKTEIISALRQCFQPGDVFELRILDAVTAEYQRPHVESGYFNFEHIEAVLAAMATLRCYRGAYVTVTPVNSALLARAVNRIRSVGREPTTTISRRIYIIRISVATAVLFLGYLRKMRGKFAV